MIDKTMALFDKTKPMNTLFRNWGRFSNLRLVWRCNRNPVIHNRITVACLKYTEQFCQ